MDKAIGILKKYVSPSTRIAIAVSGGEDSMCLCHLVLNAPFIDNKNVIFININHKIRAESDNDSHFVKAFAEANNINCICVEEDIPALSKKYNVSEETAGRLFRKQQFDKLLNGTVDYVLTAHHYLDQVETILMHIFRGTGLKGLIGMKECENGYLRPLIHTTKQCILNYVKDNNIDFVVDKTNFDICYNRNFVRNEIIPKIEQRYSLNCFETISRNATEDYNFIMSQIDNSKVGFDGKQSFLPIDILSLPYSLSSRYIFLALEKIGLKNDVTYDHVENVLKLVHCQTGKQVDILGNIKCIRQYDKIVFYKKDSEIKEDIEFFTGLTNFGDYTLSILPCDNTIIQGELKIDGDLLPDNCIIRFRRPGDIFTPCNGKSKKLKQYLIDKKIPLLFRDKLPLLCYNNIVIAIFGVEINDCYKLSTKTSNALLLKIY